MALKVSLRHLTSYKYDRPVILSPHIIRLKPAAHCRTPISAYSLNIRPADHFRNWQQDPFGNFLARTVFTEPQTHFEVEVGLIADMSVINPFDFFVEPEAETFPFAYPDRLKESLAPYLEKKEDGPLLRSWLKKVNRKPRRTVSFLMELNQGLQQDIKYGIRLEPGIQACEETLALKSGSCRDSAWLLVQALRHLGLAARFASGYLIQLKPDGPPLEGPLGPVKDFTDLHAWAEVYVPGAGWIGLDSTSGLMAGEGHIPLSCTPSPEDAAPITGAISACKTEFSHLMEIHRILEAPRVTAPISDEAWRDLLALGDKVDEDLVRTDVRLTHGGEPTFVSIDDMDGAQWNTEALGAEKYTLANELLWKLQPQFAPGSVLHYGQGKWYPGEPLPRWALTLYWRPDGHPVWKDQALQAKESHTAEYGVKEAENLAKALTKLLGVDADHLIPAYEDGFHYLAKEGGLPHDLDPHKPLWRNDQDRARLLKILGAGLDQKAGFVLPLGADYNHGFTQWRSGPWVFRRENLYLLPGDSPVGYRLPLDSLLTIGPVERNLQFPAEVSPLAPRSLLRESPWPPKEKPPEPPAQPISPASAQGKPAPAASIPKAQVPAFIAPPIRTALCVEARQGHLYVFLPPLTNLESFLELIGAIEAAATELGLTLRIEGYRPPHDHRLKSFSITPDPGVIEVNIHPSASWRELVGKTETLFEAAHQSRLGAEKFQLDGRHTGTGGGNHIVLGAEKPEDSPFLRRPHLLRSMIGFWQNHPSLSYLFSGLFIGPTSQAPRVDEARDEVLSELQLAFNQVPDGYALFPWQVDRIFRHLLVDLTGNTHRSELCIDKLYSPDSLSGRLGLLELRGFEMPPHVRLSVAQSLLVRALVARFWDQPYRAPLQRWGTALKDRWMLPHFLWNDFKDVLGHLQSAGYAFDPAWYAPFLEFRFPRLGELDLDGMHLEIRQAGEPWHILGEEATGQGTARYVDSSLERVQVKAQGFVSNRHAVTCNGLPLPMARTGIDGESVAGVRYRAWQPPSCLHPLIPVHAPLTFEIVDTWSRKSLGGCTYHVTHPAGRNYQVFPVNAGEADARRGSRFEKIGHRPGEITIYPLPVNVDYPLTLDLRLH